LFFKPQTEETVYAGAIRCQGRPRLQVYVGDHHAKGLRLAKELKDFPK
jgi:hypothetical protein